MNLIKRFFRLFFCAILLVVFSSGRGKSSFMLVLLPDTQTYTIITKTNLTSNLPSKMLNFKP
jgi:hypothetical protein